MAGRLRSASKSLGLLAAGVVAGAGGAAALTAKAGSWAFATAPFELSQAEAAVVGGIVKAHAPESIGWRGMACVARGSTMICQADAVVPEGAEHPANAEHLGQ